MQPQSFLDFYRTSKDGCFRALAVTVQSYGEAEELLAESFTRALADWDSLRQHPAPEAWIVRTALNLHRDRWRRLLHANKYRASQRGYTFDTPDFVDPELIRAIRSLPEKQRLVIAYRVLLDLSIAQTATEMGIATGTVAAHLNRALSALRTRLNQQNWIEE